MLQEETLTETLKTCGVSSNKRKRKCDRGAESYDFEEHRVRQEDDLRLKITAK